MMNVRPRIAIVTGSARGIGLAIAEELLRSNRLVVLTDVDEAELKRGQEYLREFGQRTIAVPCDVSKAGSVAKLISHTVEWLGPPTILVNNAGISPKRSGAKVPIEEMDLDEWRLVMDVNLTGTFMLCKAVIPHMKKEGWGRIINIASQAGKSRPDIPGAHYSASKAGVASLARSLAVELGEFGITANSLAPGRIATEMAVAVSDEVNAQALMRTAVRRLGTPRDVAITASFLAGEDSGFVTGACFDVNGGATMN